jgi:hypothetical protein
MWFTLRDGLLGKVHQDLRKFSAIHCKANRHIIWRIYSDSSSVGFTLFKISLSICAIHSSGSEAWMSTPVVEVGLAYDWRGARAESLHTTETSHFLLRARPTRGPKPRVPSRTSYEPADFQLE